MFGAIGGSPGITNYNDPDRHNSPVLGAILFLMIELIFVFNLYKSWKYGWIQIWGYDKRTYGKKKNPFVFWSIFSIQFLVVVGVGIVMFKMVIDY
jgi:hypothetical protein